MFFHTNVKTKKFDLFNDILPCYKTLNLKHLRHLELWNKINFLQLLNDRKH